MKRLKIMTILGTRPEIIKLSEIIKKADKYFEHILVHTGQNWDYTLNEVFFSDFGLRKPDYFLECVGKNLGETIGNIIAKSYEILEKEKPDAVLILGDTNSALSAISAKRLKIPIFHMEAGNRCFDENLPEEINRRIVDHISDINLPYTEHARRYLLHEGVRKEHIFVTGSPMREVLDNYKEQIAMSSVLYDLAIEKSKYFLVSAHREENIDSEKNFLSLMNALNAVADTYKIPIIYSMHPRSKKYVEQRKFRFNPLIRSIKPFGFFDYNCLQANSYCVLSDSGTLAEESAILKFPSISLRTSTERPEVLDRGSFVIGGIEQESILQAIDLAVAMSNNNEKAYYATDYTDDNVSVKVVKIIQSYTKIINKVVWGK